MKAGWQTKPFEECIEKVTYTSKIQRKDFLEDGAYPIISQEDAFINGYWDNEDDLFKVKTPIVVFGDHTKILKYVDFDFVLGADGVKVLPPRDFLLPKFFYYQLQTANLDSLGYARHYRLLKELDIVHPSRAEQQRIVGILDEAFDGIATAKATAEQNLQNARALFESHLQSVFTRKGYAAGCPEPSAPPSRSTQRGEGWEKKPLTAVCNAIFAGGDVPKGNSSKTETDKYRIPIFTNGEKNKGLYGYTNMARVTEPSITISARGTIGYSEIRKESYYPAIRLIVLIPKKEILDLSFLYYAIESTDIGHSGTSIPQLTVPMVSGFTIPVPPIAVQQTIVGQIDALREETQRLESLYQRKLAALDELKKSLLHQAFSGAL